MKNKTIIVVVALLLSSCATGSNLGPSYAYNEIEVVNNSRETIEDLTIRSFGTGDVSDPADVFSCQNIIALGVCSDRFSRRPYKEGGFRIEWMLGDSARQTTEIEVEVPAYISPGIALRAVFEISPEGVMTAHFDQESPFR